MVVYLGARVPLTTIVSNTRRHWASPTGSAHVNGSLLVCPRSQYSSSISPQSSSRCGDLVARSPQPKVLPVDRCRHQVGEEIGRAGKSRDAQTCEGGGM